MSNSPKIIKKAKAKDVCKCDYCEKVLEIGEEHSVAIYEVQKQTYHWRTCARCKSYVKEAQQNKNVEFKYGLNNESFHQYMMKNHPEVAKEWWAL